jgi:CHRD domain-containing protein
MRRFVGYDPGGTTASWRASFKGEVTMRRVVFLMMVLALAGGCDDDNPNSPTAGPITFTAQLSPANEVPPIQGAESSGRGFAIITFNVPRDGSGNVTGAGTATFEIQTTAFPDGSQAVAAHIHPGVTGQNGGVLVTTGLAPADPINLGASTVTRTLTAPVTQVDATNIVNAPGAYYFNVHTRANGSGVMRGQLVRQ